VNDTVQLLQISIDLNIHLIVMSCDIAHVTLITAVMIVVRQCNGLKQISIRQ